MSEMAEEERKKAIAEMELENQTTKGTCDCADRKPDESIEREKEISSSIAFEDALHNAVYIKRTNLRRRREVEGILSAVPRKRDTSYAQVTRFLFPRSRIQLQIK